MDDVAVIILAHKNERQLRRLIDHLSQDLAVYLHLDSAGPANARHFTDVPTLRGRAPHGSFGFIDATVRMLALARRGRHGRYLVISGQDVPLAPNGEIQRFFEGNANEYISFGLLPRPEWAMNGGFDRISLFWEAVDSSRFASRLGARIRMVQSRHGLYRPLSYKPYYGGANWLNLTHDCVSFMLDRLQSNRRYMRSFRWTRSGDEIFFQTLILNSAFASSCVNDSLRYVDWEMGPEYPRVLRLEDYDRLAASPALFARKFDQQVDDAIIARLYERLA